MRLIDADELYGRLAFDFEMLRNGALEKLSSDDILETIHEQPTVETETVNAAVCVRDEALMEPWCEQYVKSEMARGIAHELVKLIEIRSFDSDPRRMMKEFRGRVVIIRRDDGR